MILQLVAAAQEAVEQFMIARRDGTSNTATDTASHSTPTEPSTKDAVDTTPQKKKEVFNDTATDAAPPHKDAAPADGHAGITKPSEPEAESQWWNEEFAEAPSADDEEGQAIRNEKMKASLQMHACVHKPT